jgi:hypothetical protein
VVGFDPPESELLLPPDGLDGVLVDGVLVDGVLVDGVEVLELLPVLEPLALDGVLLELPYPSEYQPPPFRMKFPLVI